MSLVKNVQQTNTCSLDECGNAFQVKWSSEAFRTAVVLPLKTFSNKVIKCTHSPHFGCFPIIFRSGQNADKAGFRNSFFVN